MKIPKTAISSQSMPVVMILRRDVPRPKEWLLARSRIGEKGCWNWTHGKTGSNYGVAYFNVNGVKKQFSTHWLSFVLCNGDLVDGMFVCHRCDNPTCVNPEHLFAGTHSDNMLDAISKGRVIPPNGLKLNYKMANEIRQRYAAGGCTTRSLAAEYNVGKSLIHAIVAGNCWIVADAPEAIDAIWPKKKK
jgi:hypothetical protein